MCMYVGCFHVGNTFLRVIINKMADCKRVGIPFDLFNHESANYISSVLLKHLNHISEQISYRKQFSIDIIGKIP